MLSFTCLCPHPPIIIPEIGGREIEKTRKTIEAVKKLEKKFSQNKPDLVLIISPHGYVQPSKMTLVVDEKLEGSLSFFGFEKTFSFSGDPKVAKVIHEESEKENIPVDLIINHPLDHGILVPLYYLSANYSDFKLLPLFFSFLPLQTHFEFGKIIGKILKIRKEKIAVVASGDLSHRLSLDAPGGYSPQGSKFDQKLMKLLKNKDIEGILNLDPQFIEEAGECGLRSIVILLGILEGAGVEWDVKILSYEAPFGVGYLVGEGVIKSKPACRRGRVKS